MPSVESWPDGNGQVVRLEDADDLLRGDAGGGQLVGIEGDDEPLLEAAGQVGAGDAVDGLDLRDDLGPGDVRGAARGRPRLVAAIDAMMTGEALMLSAETFGVDASPAGPPWRSPRWIAAVVSLTFVPYENWATTSAIEFAEVDWTVSSRGTPAMALLDRLGDLLGDVGRRRRPGTAR